MRRTKRNFSQLGILCLAVLLAMGAMGVGLAHWQETLTIDTTVGTGSWGSGETPGFWKNCIQEPAIPDHYSASQTNIWLNYIDEGGGLVTASLWLVPDIAPDPDGDGVGDGIIDIADMLAIFDAGLGPDKEEQFLRHYLATRLNVEAGGLSLGTTHDVIGISSGYGYLGLATPLFATLTDIIAAIESKYGTSVTPAQFEIMKNICDFLNHQDI